MGRKKLVETILSINPHAKIIIASGYNVQEYCGLCNGMGRKGFSKQAL
jgi:hypothetical protein